MSAHEFSVTSAEAYAQWGDRIRCLFAAPPTPLDTTVAHSPFERHSCAVPFTSPPREETEPNIDHYAENEERNTDHFYDEAMYPFCFYTRLLRGRGGAQDTRDGATAACEVDFQAAKATQHLRIDDDDLARRLAQRLRARTRDTAAAAAAAQQQHYQPGVTSVALVSSFCDPKVEQQQARLHSELTEFLLEVRARNEASAVLRRQLLRSRVVRERIHDMEDPSGMAVRDAESS